MKSGPLATLFHPFESGGLASPQAGRFLFLGAKPGFRPPEGFGAELHLVQGFRPHFRALAAAGYKVTSQPEGTGFDGALVLAGRHRGQNEAWIAEAIERVVSGGLIVVAGSKDDGIASLRKRMEGGEDALTSAIARKKSAGPIVAGAGQERLYRPFQGSVPLEGHLSKYHGIVFWLRRTEEAEAFAASVKTWQTGRPLIEGRFHTAPGMFSHDRIDTGSRLLAECLPENAKGAAADFGAGWGYLASVLAEHTAGLKAIDLYEADYESLEAAKANLTNLPNAPEFGFFWFDLVGEKVERKYDLIVMNPPFHQSRAAESGIGQAMIRAASSALKHGGQLLMVANRGLPYDQALKAGFKDVQELRSEGGFRVIAARR
jgi:16S rRNA (guanine1207-N2)-methyltransferase